MGREAGVTSVASQRVYWNGCGHGANGKKFWPSSDTSSVAPMSVAAGDTGGLVTKRDTGEVGAAAACCVGFDGGMSCVGSAGAVTCTHPCNGSNLPATTATSPSATEN